MIVTGLAPAALDEVRRQAGSVPHRLLLLFGSHARGDAAEDSDIDVLLVVEHHRPSFRKEPISFSCYTCGELLRMGREGSLFTFHLLLEGVFLSGSKKLWDELQDSFRVPNLERAREDVRLASDFLDVGYSSFNTRPVAYCQLARHLLRTWLYAEAVARGCRSFAMETVAELLCKQEEATLTRSNSVNFEQFLQTRSALERCLGGVVVNEYLTAEALIVNLWGRSRNAVALGLRLLHDGACLSYEELSLEMEE
jgi:predicted nucleotidyltransferase